MTRLLVLLLLAAGCKGKGTPASAAASERLGIGRAATPEEVSALDTDVLPDGTGLPVGSGSVELGATVYAAKCARCHGATGTEGPLDVLVGRAPPEGYRLGSHRGHSVVTIGNYWPYATTLFDYLRRSMPWDSPGSLGADEVYALCAWLLHQNELLPADATLDATSLPKVEMPALHLYVRDDRHGGNEVR